MKASLHEGMGYQGLQNRLRSIGSTSPLIMSLPAVDVEQTTRTGEATSINVRVDGDTAIDVTVDEDGHIEVGIGGDSYTRVFGPDDDPDTCAIIDGIRTRIMENYEGSSGATSLQELREIRNRAAVATKDGDGGEDLVRICEEALTMEGTLYRFAARAAIAELAKSWVDAAGNGDQSEGSFPDRLVRIDIPRVIEALKGFSRSVAQQTAEVFEVRSEVDEALEDPGRIIAAFRRQEWRGPDEDRLHTIETEYWDVTARIETMEREKVEGLRDNDYSSDRLVQPYAQHDGPHSVRVADQIETYWRHHGREPLWD